MTVKELVKGLKYFNKNFPVRVYVLPEHIGKKSYEIDKICYDFDYTHVKIFVEDADAEEDIDSIFNNLPGEIVRRQN